jgi:GNAT superfamily N-acetyltransferase
MEPSQPRQILRALRDSDLKAALVLSRAAGWNQTLESWRLTIGLARGGAFALEKSGRLVGTVSTIAYPDGGFGWIGMMLVDSAERGRGLGRALLERAIVHLRGLGLRPALDATPLGEPLYRRQGFESLAEIARWSGEARPSAASVAGVRRLSVADLPHLFALDRAAFGAERGELLRGLQELPGSFALAHAGEFGAPLGGYLCARPGARFTYVGPIVANDGAVAAALLRAALARCSGSPVGLDLPRRHGEIEGLAAASGLRMERPLRRMAQPESSPGSAFPGGDLRRIYGLASPEWG